MYVEYFLVYVFTLYAVLYRGIASPGESFTLECSSNKPLTQINWYRNNIPVASTERYTETVECGVINIVKYIKFTVGRCDQHVQQLIINNVSYTEDNGVHWSCSDDTTTNKLILRVVEPTSATANTLSPVNIETTATTETTSFTAASQYTETTATIETTSFTATSQYTETTEVTATTLTDSEQMNAKQVKPEQTVVIIAGSVGAAVLVLVVALVVSIMIYKHRKKSAATREPIMTENDLHVSAGPSVDGVDNVTGSQSQRQTKFPEYAKVSETNRPHQPTSETIIMENDLYTSADQPTTEPIIMENDLYTSAYQCQTDCADIDIDQTGNAHFNSSVTTPGDTDGPVYSIVNKHKNPVPVHGDKDGPVYSIVNKHNN